MLYEIIYPSIDKITLLLIVFIFFLMDYRPPWWKKQFGKKNSGIPGPRSIPILGTRWIFYFCSYELSKIHEFYDEMYKKYGPLAKEEALFNIPLYNVFEKDDIEKILKSPSKYPIRPPSEALAFYRYSRPDRYASAGLVNEQGEKWYFLRTSLTSNLTSPKTISSFQNVAYNLAEDWCSYIREKKGLNNHISNINNIVVVLCIETTCALVLGRRLGFLSPQEVPEKYIKLAEALQENFKSLRDTQYSLPFWKYITTEAYKKMAESENYIYETISEILQEYSNENFENSVYSSIINAKIDEKEKTAAIIDFIAAGIHTLKNSLIFLLYLAAKNPKTHEKISNNQNYAKACVLESFRLLPTATPLARILEKDLEISGFQLSSGSVVLCHNAVACKSEKNFENPEEFLPERWLEEDRLKNSTFLVTPFGAGRRICPGKRFIELVLPIFLREIVSNFEISTEHVLELQFEFLRAPKQPIPMDFKDRF